MIPAPTLEMMRPAHGPNSLSAALRWMSAGREHGAQRMVSLTSSAPEATMYNLTIGAIQYVINDYVKWLNERATTEYRLVVDKGYQTKVYPKTRGLEQAQKGLLDAFRDFGRYKDSTRMDAWIESRTVTDWERTED